VGDQLANVTAYVKTPTNMGASFETELRNERRTDEAKHFV
jgi:hypothetical protein